MISKRARDAQDEVIQNNANLERTASARDPEEMLESIIEGIAYMVLEASDEDILAESREQGADPMKEAEEVRKVLLAAAKSIMPEAEDSPQKSIGQAGIPNKAG